MLIVIVKGCIFNIAKNISIILVLQILTNFFVCKYYFKIKKPWLCVNFKNWDLDWGNYKTGSLKKYVK